MATNRDSSKLDIDALLRESQSLYLSEEHAPVVDRAKLIALARGALSPEAARFVDELCASFKSWDEAYTQVLAEECANVQTPLRTMPPSTSPSFSSLRLSAVLAPPPTLSPTRSTIQTEVVVYRLAAESGKVELPIPSSVATKCYDNSIQEVTVLLETRRMKAGDVEVRLSVSPAPTHEALVVMLTVNTSPSLYFAVPVPRRSARTAWSSDCISLPASEDMAMADIVLQFEPGEA